MINKKWILVIVVIAAIVIAGIFLALKFTGSDNMTGNAANVPETEEITETAEETGETTVDAGKFSEIVEEMSKSDVKDLLGEPVDKQTITTPKGNTIEYWYYETDEGVYQIGFDSMGVSVVRKY